MVRELDISSRGLTALPPEIGQLPGLESLHLFDNALTTLPEEMGRLTAPQYLGIGMNRLSRLPHVLWWLTSLRELDIHRNSLKVLPEALTRLEHLEKLVANATPLSTLPNWLPLLARLRKLYLGEAAGGCPLRHLPECLRHMPQLEVLSVNTCELVSLPEWLGELRSLRVLNLENNRLTALPTTLHGLAQAGTLRKLFLHGNPALGLPEEVLGPNWRSGKGSPPHSILDYYFRTRGEEGRELRELKLIVVGRGAAGKTTLIKRLRGMERDPREPETHGITICPLDLDCLLDGKKAKVKARVWDFGGQHVLHSMHQFFLTARSLYLLVLNEREELEDADARYWLQIIRAAAGDVPVVIALNKSKGRARERSRADLEKEYGPIAAWVATECEPKDVAAGASDGLGELRAALDKAACSVPGVQARWAKKWDAVKDWLEKSAAPWLTYPDYETGCAERGEPDKEEQEKLAGYLHELGIALNYGRDPRLRETSVLRPDWLANGIYALLRANDHRHEELLAPEAIIRARDMAAIYRAAEKLGMLQAKDYPADRWWFLLRLMGAFQLSYPLDAEGTEHLVPVLLPADAPAGTDEPPGPDRTRLRYEGQPIPGPLLPRFLVRSYAPVQDHLAWRTGAVFIYGKAKARVWLEDERRLRLTFAGPEADRGELQTMLQGTLDELLAEYPHAKVKEQWEVEGEFVNRRYLELTKVLPPKDPVPTEGGKARARHEKTRPPPVRTRAEQRRRWKSL